MSKNKQKLELTWIGKDREVNLEPRILVEVPEKSYGDKDTENMLIHGDNLLALKALEQDFTGKIKCIYIDPPFNTDARFDSQGNKLPYDDCVEHSIWLQLMKQRFEILFTLLKDDGFLFVNLDDEEAAYAKILLDEIFGRNNYLNEIIVATNKAFGFKSTSDGIFKQANHLLLYAKDKTQITLNEDALFTEKGYDEQYKWVFENTDKSEDLWTWRNIKNVVAENLGYFDAKEAQKKLGEDFSQEVFMFAIENADRVFRTASVSGGALLKRKDTINYSKQHKDKIIRHPNDDMDYMFIGGERVIYYKERLKQIDGQLLPGDLITDIWNDISVEGLASEGMIDFPKGKKPEKLIKRCIDITTKEGDFVLDSFLGSGTTAAVAHKMKRKWIGIELGNHCYTHCEARMQNVISGTDKTGISKSVNWQGGGGYKFYELAPSLLKKDEFDNWIIEPKYDAEMLAEAMAKHEGYKFSPDETNVYKQGKSTEKDFIFTTTQFISLDLLNKIASQINEDESLLICATHFEEGIYNKFSNITIKKIPQILLDRCEFGKLEYNLNIVEEAQPEDFDEEEILEDEE